MTIRTIIIDDDPFWQDLLTKQVNHISILEHVGTYSSALDAYSQIAAGNIDLLLLDIDMPNISGINFVKSLDNSPLIVFVTSHPQFAVDGFEVAAVDFLIKPFELERFIKSIERVRQRLEANNALKSGYAAPSEEYFFIKTQQEAVKLRYDDVIYIKSLENYVQVFTVSGQIHTTSLTLTTCEKILPSSIFIRIHRSFLINSRFLTSINKNTLSLKGEHKITNW